MTLLIRDVRIIGGVQEFPEHSDVFVNGDKISAIGNFPNKAADAVLDGHGAYLSPGFIDVNTDSDHYLTLFDHPSQEDFLRQGVTTIFGGMCGSSLAPLLYGSLESMGKWSDPNSINVNWHTMKEFLATFDKRPLAVNFGTLVGHATIRRAIVGETSRDLTKNELGVFSRTLKAALEEGGFGLSSGLAYVHAKKTSYQELKFLADITKKFGGVYATHLRDMESGIVAAVEETIRLAKETGVRTIVSHFVPRVSAENEYEKALGLIEGLPKETDLRFDIYPSRDSLLPIYTFLPAWAQTNNVTTMLANVKDEWFVSRIKKDMPHLDEDHFIVAQAPNNDFLVGKSLTEIKQMYELHDGRDALIRLMATMNMRGGVLVRNISERPLRRALKSPRSFIASNAPSFAEKPFRGRQIKSDRTTRTFTDFLALVEKENLMPLEEAILKITREPAREFGLALRGTVALGNFADLACFSNGEVRFTVVNGRVAMENGEFRGAFAGKALRHKAAS